MQEACRRMQEALGRDAVVLHTRSFRRGGLLGIGAREVFEITACAGTELAADYRTARRIIRGPGGPNEPARAPEAAAARPPERGSRHVDGAAASREDPTRIRVLESEISEIKGMISDLVLRSRMGGLPDVSEGLVKHYIAMVDGGVEKELARRLVRRANDELSGDALRDDRRLRSSLVGYLAELMPSAGGIRLTPGRCATVCFIGPTGVGKTTTLAKLAANFALREGRSVGIMTADTYRIAAVEQLRRYAELMDVPLVTVNSPGDARRRLAEFSSFDLVLVDTAGRSQHDDMKMNELRSYMEALRPDETHLVLSATSRGKALESATEAFGELGADRIVVTKLDEVDEFGFLPTLALKAGRHLSFVTNGQRVPEDILTADPVALAELVLRREAA